MPIRQRHAMANQMWGWREWDWTDVAVLTHRLAIPFWGLCLDCLTTCRRFSHINVPRRTFLILATGPCLPALFAEVACACRMFCLEPQTAQRVGPASTRICVLQIQLIALCKVNNRTASHGCDFPSYRLNGKWARRVARKVVASNRLGQTLSVRGKEPGTRGYFDPGRYLA